MRNCNRAMKGKNKCIESDKKQSRRNKSIKGGNENKIDEFLYVCSFHSL